MAGAGHDAAAGLPGQRTGPRRVRSPTASASAASRTAARAVTAAGGRRSAAGRGAAGLEVGERLQRVVQRSATLASGNPGSGAAVGLRAVVGRAPGTAARRCPARADHLQRDAADRPDLARRRRWSRCRRRPSPSVRSVVADEVEDAQGQHQARPTGRRRPSRRCRRRTGRTAGRSTITPSSEPFRSSAAFVVTVAVPGLPRRVVGDRDRGPGGDRGQRPWSSVVGVGRGRAVDRVDRVALREQRPSTASPSARSWTTTFSRVAQVPERRRLSAACSEVRNACRLACRVCCYGLVGRVHRLLGDDGDLVGRTSRAPPGRG